MLLKVMLALCGLWNLDLLRPIVPPFCVSPNMKNLHAFALEYIEAFYPIILILITYICIKVHDRNFRLVVLLWKPFHQCFVYFRRSWDCETSVIRAFSTFLLLSFSKVLFVSFTLLYAVEAKLLNRNGTRTSFRSVMYYDSTVQPYSEDHLPFAGLSLCVGLLFIVFPTFLLILYPTRIFRKCISCCRFRRWHALHTFMEAFQGQHKDGTNGSKDFRAVSALYLLFRIAALLIYSGDHRYGTHAYACLATAVVFVSTSLFFAIIKPYKVNYFNAIDSIILAMLGLLSMVCQFVLYLPNQKYAHVIAVCGLLTAGIPHATLGLYILYIVVKKIKIAQCAKKKFQCLLTVLCWNEHTLAETDNGVGSLPDRLVNPNEYERLIPAINQQGTANFQTAFQARATAMNTYGIAGD